MRILLGILIFVILIIIAMFVSSTCRDRVKGIFCPAVAPLEKQIGIQEQKIPDVKSLAEAPADQVKPAAPKEEEGNIYIVQVKDDLVSISEKMLGNSAKWIEIYNANRDIIKNPTMIFPGQKLKMPPVKEEKK